LSLEIKSKKRSEPKHAHNQLAAFTFVHLLSSKSKEGCSKSQLF